MAHRIQDCQGTQMKFNENLGPQFSKKSFAFVRPLYRK